MFCIFHKFLQNLSACQARMQVIWACQARMQVHSWMGLWTDPDSVCNACTDNLNACNKSTRHCRVFLKHMSITQQIYTSLLCISEAHVHYAPNPQVTAICFWSICLLQTQQLSLTWVSMGLGPRPCCSAWRCTSQDMVPRNESNEFTKNCCGVWYTKLAFRYGGGSTATTLQAAV